MSDIPAPEPAITEAVAAERERIRSRAVMDALTIDRPPSLPGGGQVNVIELDRLLNIIDPVVTVPRGMRVHYVPPLPGRMGGGPCQAATIVSTGDGDNDIFAVLALPGGAITPVISRDERGPGLWGEDTERAYRGSTWHLALPCRGERERSAPPPYKPDKGLIGYAEKGQRPPEERPPDG